MTRVAVIGAGSWGTAVAAIVAANASTTLLLSITTVAAGSVVAGTGRTMGCRWAVLSSFFAHPTAVRIVTKNTVESGLESVIRVLRMTRKKMAALFSNVRRNQTVQMYLILRRNSKGLQNYNGNVLMPDLCRPRTGEQLESGGHPACPNDTLGRMVVTPGSNASRLRALASEAAERRFERR